MTSSATRPSNQTLAINVLLSITYLSQALRPEVEVCS